MTTIQGTPTDRFRIGKAYTAAQAARLSGVTPGTIRNWMLGYQNDEYEMAPVLGPKSRSADEAFSVSFLELAELIIVAKYRKLRMELAEIRGAHGVLSDEWKVAYPFATLQMVTLGGRILARYQADHPSAGDLVVLTNPAQGVLPGIVQDELERFDFDKAPEDPFAFRWHPFGRDIPIVVDPRFAGGKMTILGRGITIEALKRRKAAGESDESIAEGYDLKVPLVRAVLKRVA